VKNRSDCGLVGGAESYASCASMEGAICGEEFFVEMLEAGGRRHLG